MSIIPIIEEIRGRLDDPSFPDIARWKRENPDGKVIGYFPVYTPVEMVHAAGMLPVLVAGAGGRVRLDEADGCLQSFVCSIGRSTLELKLDGFLQSLDGMIFPSTCEISRGLSGVWSRHDPNLPVIYVNYPQNLSSSAALDYLISELNRLKGWIEEIAGQEIGSEAFYEAFDAYNRRSELLNRLDQFRLEHPEKLSASEFYVLRLAGMAISVEEHSDILDRALKALEDTEDQGQDAAYGCVLRACSAVDARNDGGGGNRDSGR